MLVLTRKLQEKIQIGNEITITILRMKGNTVRVGIEAPRDVRVVRAELTRFEDAPTDGVPVGESNTVDVSEQFEVELATDSDAVAVESSAAAQEPAGKTPSVGRRFIIQQKVGRFGRPQITAVAAT